MNTNKFVMTQLEMCIRYGLKKAQNHMPVPEQTETAKH